MAENVFEAVKQSVSTREAAAFYGIEVKRNGMACCPFHDDHIPICTAAKAVEPLVYLHTGVLIIVKVKKNKRHGLQNTQQKSHTWKGD